MIAYGFKFRRCLREMVSIGKTKFSTFWNLFLDVREHAQYLIFSHAELIMTWVESSHRFANLLCVSLG